MFLIYCSEDTWSNGVFLLGQIPVRREKRGRWRAILKPWRWTLRRVPSRWSPTPVSPYSRWRRADLHCDPMCDLCTVTFGSELFCLCQDEAELDLTVSDMDLTEAAWCSTVTICAVKSFVDVVLNAWAPRVYQVVSNLCTKRGLIHCWMH